MTTAVFTLQGEYIELKALLKLTDLVSSGGEAKMVISEGQVRVDGEVWESEPVAELPMAQRYFLF